MADARATTDVKLTDEEILTAWQLTENVGIPNQEGSGVMIDRLASLRAKLRPYLDRPEKQNPRLEVPTPDNGARAGDPKAAAAEAPAELAPVGR